MRQIIHYLLIILRKSRLNRPITRLLVTIHNASYQLISFFASSSGTHPKHTIINYHKFFLDNIDANNTVLDIGCGKGEVARSVSQKAKEVVGIDISNKNIQLADENKTPTNLSYIVGDATTYRFNQKFDVIILSNVLEHIKNRVDFLKKLSGIAPRILIRVPMITRDWISVYKKNEGFAYRLDDTHYIEYDLHSFFKEIKEANLKILHYHINFGELYAVVQKLEK